MPTERRRARRANPIKQLHGSLKIQAAGQELQAEAVQDISPYGICVLVPAPIDSKVDFNLYYRDEDLAVEVVGSIIWCEPLDNPGQSTTGLHRIGLAFDQHCMQQNTLLFRALMDQQPSL